jgi:hypothetical protein
MRASRRVNKSQTKVLAGSSIWLSNQPRGLLIRSFQLTYLRGDCKAWRPATSLQQTRSTFGNKEMCHVEILHCSRVGLADCDPDAHPDCKRSPRVTGEFFVRRQRLLTNSRANEHFCSRLNSQDARLAFARRPPATTDCGRHKMRNRSRLDCGGSVLRLSWHGDSATPAVGIRGLQRFRR